MHLNILSKEMNFEDIDYTEDVTFLPGFEVDDETVKQFLVALCTETL